MYVSGGACYRTLNGIMPVAELHQHDDGIYQLVVHKLQRDTRQQATVCCCGIDLQEIHKFNKGVTLIALSFRERSFSFVGSLRELLEALERGNRTCPPKLPRGQDQANRSR